MWIVCLTQKCFTTRVENSAVDRDWKNSYDTFVGILCDSRYIELKFIIKSSKSK